MNFQQWKNKYYPNETQETLQKMAHAWASAHDACYCINCKEWLEPKCSDPECRFCSGRPGVWEGVG